MDTSVLIAAMVGTESHHAACRTLVPRQKCGMYVHGIAEALSTLTGGRKSFRLGAAQTAELLTRSFVPALAIVTLTPGETLRALKDCAARGVRGGVIFDHLHLAAARKAGAPSFHTLNLSNFLAFHRAGDPAILPP